MRSELPWVWVVQNKHATPKGLLPTGNESQQRLQRRGDRRLEPRVARFALQPWATRSNAFGVEWDRSACVFRSKFDSNVTKSFRQTFLVRFPPASECRHLESQRPRPQESKLGRTLGLGWERLAGPAASCGRDFGTGACTGTISPAGHRRWPSR